MNSPEAPTQDLALALDDAFTALVKVLHLNGSLDIEDLTREIGATVDFRRSAKEYAGDRKLPHLVALHGKLIQLEPLLAELRRIRSETKPDGT